MMAIISFKMRNPVFDIFIESGFLVSNHCLLVIMAKKCTEWTPYERKRSRGRPRKRWRDEIVEKAGVNWMRRTGKRLSWKTLGRPPACSGLNGS